MQPAWIYILIFELGFKDLNEMRTISCIFKEQQIKQKLFYIFLSIKDKERPCLDQAEYCWWTYCSCTSLAQIYSSQTIFSLSLNEAQDIYYLLQNF